MLNEPEVRVLAKLGVPTANIVGLPRDVLWELYPEAALIYRPEYWNKHVPNLAEGSPSVLKYAIYSGYYLYQLREAADLYMDDVHLVEGQEPYASAVKAVQLFGGGEDPTPLMTIGSHVHKALWKATQFRSHNPERQQLIEAINWTVSSQKLWLDQMDEDFLIKRFSMYTRTVRLNAEGVLWCMLAHTVKDYLTKDGKAVLDEASKEARLILGVLDDEFEPKAVLVDETA